MAPYVLAEKVFAVDLDVLRAVGGAGNAVFVSSLDSADKDATDSLAEECLEIGWRPLVITFDENVDDHGHRPHQMSAVVHPTELLSYLANRFHSGIPIHYLAIDEQDDSQVVPALAAMGIHAWILRQAAASTDPTGYQKVGERDTFTWWVLGEHSHLSGGVATVVGSADPGGFPETRGLSRRLRGRATYVGKRVLALLPEGVSTPLVRRRHLSLVQGNQEHLIDPAYLGRPEAREVNWITAAGLPPVPPAGLDLGPLEAEQVLRVGQWLDLGPHDSDAMLDRRMDNHGDELGRTVSALRSRITMAKESAKDQATSAQVEGRVLFDARALQTPSFGTRGIGRFALAALVELRKNLTDDELVLLVDRRLEVLPAHMVEECQQITRVTTDSVSRFGLFVQPSPMTADPRPYLPLLDSNVRKAAVVFDFIPAHYPSVYLTHPAACAEYAACLDALCAFDDFLCISNETQHEMRSWLDIYRRDDHSYRTTVTWPEEIDVSLQTANAATNRDGPIVVMTGDEGRKNTYGALAAIGVATAGLSSRRDVRVVGMPGHDVRIHHWAIAAGLREGEVQNCSRLSDEELDELLESASAVVVASFDEGLSLPVIEAARRGTPVIGSDIATHRELIGSGTYLVPAGDIQAMADAIRHHRGRRTTSQRQRKNLQRHAHTTLESGIRSLLANSPKISVPKDQVSAPMNRGRLSIGVAAPLPPQPTGVGDYSAATIRELTALADVTVYTTSDAHPLPGAEHRHVAELFDGEHDHDVLVSVVGNSHFHLPFVDLLGIHECVSIAHDTRMVEFYTSLRSKGGAEQVMLRGQPGGVIAPSLDEQIDDMRLLQNAGLWEIARQSRELIMHSVSAAPRILAQTGIKPTLLPFAHYRDPDIGEVTDQIRQEARSRLGFSDDVLHLGTFGYVDIRTKLTDVVVEAAAWLTQWGHRVALHVIGSASPDQTRSLTRRARVAGIEEFTVTGYVSEAQYQDYLLAIDLGIQLRISPLLGVSGPLADMAAFGTPALASRGLCVDVDAPDFITRLPDDVSSLLVAESIEEALGHPTTIQSREEQRRAYLFDKSPRRYAEQLHAVLTRVVQS